MAIGQERFSAGQHVDHRRRDRRDCNLPALLATRDGESSARIINISAGGLGFIIDPMLGLKPGERVMLRQSLLGEVRCVVRWGMHPRYGAEFEPAGRTPPGAQALYDSLSPSTGAAG